MHIRNKLLLEAYQINRAQKVITFIDKHPDLDRLILLGKSVDLVEEYDDGSYRHLFSIKFFNNCREQGYHLEAFGSGFTLGFSFAENRNSDDIVVYTNANCPEEQFNDYGMPVKNDDSLIWDSHKYFRSEKLAADYIVATSIKVLQAKDSKNKLQYLEKLK